MQISESHCGPAVIQMMLSYLGIDVSQEQVAEAGGATSLIELNGMRVDQLAQAVHHLAPKVLFYVREYCTLDQLVRIVRDYHFPVGVEWQGVFEDEEAAVMDRANQVYHSARQGQKELMPGNETEDSDYGHYSLVIRVDRRRKELIIADPYKDFFSQARIFHFEVFDRRWYDYNEIPDPITGKPVIKKDDHLMFVVVPRNVLFPLRIGMFRI